MALRKYSNNVNTTLASSISAATTSLAVSAGTGSLFPAITAPQYFTATLIKANTPTVYEVILVQGRTGDNFTTIVRAQEGTAALTWNAGDTVALLPTAAGQATFVQFDDLQAQFGNYAIDTGSANAYVVALTPPLTAHAQGTPIRWMAGHTNTGASTFNDGAGSAALQTPEGAALFAGEISAGGIYEAVWDGAHFQVTTVHAVSFSQLAGTIFNSQVPAAAVLQFLSQILANAALTGAPTAPTATLGDNSTRVATDQFVNPGSSINTNGYRKHPDGSITQWGRVPYSGAGTSLTLTFPLPWPTAMFSISFVGIVSGFQPGVQSFTNTQLLMETSQMQGTANTFYWIAEGH